MDTYFIIRHSNVKTERFTEQYFFYQFHKILFITKL